VNEAGVLQDLRDFFMALVFAQARTLAMFGALPIFSSQVMPGMLRLGAAAAVGMVIAPALLPAVHAEIPALQIVFLLCKEAFTGFVLGYAVAVPFWAFEAAGFFIDNQRGASIAATLNPLTGNDSSPLGILFNQAFIVFFFVSGGFLLMLAVLYDSYRLWPMLDWAPTLRAETVPLLIAQLDHVVRLALLYGGPVIVAMFLAELGLALVSRFVPQLQVFFLAMPIKSALAILVLVMYCATMFDMARDSIDALKDIAPFFQQQWRQGSR
jgi:type III secretion protein T